MFDWIVESIRTALQPAPARANERKRLAEERRRAAQERRTARRKATDEAIASADAPTLAWFWHNAVEHLCAPCGDPNAEHIHVFWITSHKLAVAAETLARPHRSLLALRGATTGLSGNVDLVQMFFATDPVFVPLRQQAAAEVSEILVAFELQAQREATRPTAPEGSASGHWVPARSLVKEDDDRFSTPAKIKAFCIKHGIPHRPGVTKNGKPWTQRCDVQLEAWETKVADLDAEVQHLQDTADAMTANRPRFKAWRGEGRDDPK